MAYVAPPPLHRIQEVGYGLNNQLLVCQALVNGALATVSGTATCTVYVNGGSTALVSGNCTQAAGVMTYSLNASDTNTYVLQQVYRAIFSFSVSGITAPYLREVVFVVTRVPVEDACPVRLDDLRGNHVRFDAVLNQAGQATDAVGRYIIPAWQDVRETLEASGISVSTVNPASVFNLVRYRALCNLAIGFIQSPGDVYGQLLGEYKERYREALNRVVVLSRQGDVFTVTQSRGDAATATVNIGPDHATDLTRMQGGWFGATNAGPFRGIR